MKKQRRLISNIIYALKIIDSPVYMILNIINKSLDVSKNAILVVFFLNTFLAMIEENNSIDKIIILLSLYAAVLLLINVYSIFFNQYYRPSKLPQIQAKLKIKLFEKSMQSDMDSFDNPEYYNDYVWSMTNVEETIIEIMDNISNLVGNVIVIISISSFFIAVDLVVMLAVIVSVGITMLLYTFMVKTNVAKDIALNPYRRKAEYFKRVFYLKDYSKELRITNIVKLLIDQFDENESDICGVLRKYGKRLMIYSGINGLTISTLLDIALRILLTYKLMVARTILLAEYTASTFAVWSLFSSLNGTVWLVNRFPECGLRIQKLYNFLSKPAVVYNTGSAPVALVAQGNNLTLKNVDFSYDKAGGKILDNISFSLRQGETLAIVGANGSGKSTLVKLLLGLYQPSNGAIQINRQNLDEIDIKAYRKLFGVVFQDFSFFSASIAQNVALDRDYDRKQLSEALNKSLFYQDNYLKTLSLDAMLTREFTDDGIVLSGGQAQKLIIARAFLEQPFIIMDEPSSALDVESEMQLNDAVLQNAGNKAVIIIAHRLTTAKRANRIIVMEKGKIIEEGTHVALMKKGGQYYRMFTLQAKQYQYEGEM